MKRGKKYIEAAKLIERGNLYDPAEAVALVKKSATAKFDETIEAHIRTGCDGRHADQHLHYGVQALCGKYGDGGIVKYFAVCCALGAGCALCFRRSAGCRCALCLGAALAGRICGIGRSACGKRKCHSCHQKNGYGFLFHDN